MRYILIIFSIFLFSLTIISCSSEDDAALKQGKVAKDLSEADQLEAPSGSVLINNGDTTTSSSQVSLTLSASDAGLVSGYYVSETNSSPSSTATGWGDINGTQNYSATVDFTISNTTTLGEHPRTVYAWFKDTAENVSSASSDSITLVVADTIAPSSKSIVINNDNSSATNTAVILALSASDNYGISAYYISETSTAPSSSNSGWTSVTSSTNFSSTISFTLTGASSAGSYSRTVYAWFKDDAGNISSSASDEITLIINDTTNPSNPTIIVNNGDSSTNSTAVTLALSATDNVGITAYYASENNSTPTSNASGWNSVTSSANYSDNVIFSLASTGSAGTFSKTVYIWFKDATGNVSSYSSDAINLVVTDTTAPASPSIIINSGADNTTSTDVTLTFSATDSEGVTSYYASESSTAPANNASGWTSVTSSTSYSDNVSFSLSNVSSFGTHSRTIYVWYKDNAGNVSVSASGVIVLIKKVIYVSSGGNHNCAILISKKVYCWGQNDYRWGGGIGGIGQLGDGTTANSSTPVLVKNIDNSSLISAGHYHNCSVLTDGKIKCRGWGTGYGVSGLNSAMTLINGISTAISVSSSVGEVLDQGTCAMLSDGTVKCWGGLWTGNGLTSGSTSPVTATGINSTTSVSTGGDHICSSLADGTIKCWVRNTYGQLGTGNEIWQTTPALVNGISTAKAVSAGNDFTCALLLDGTIKCWGRGTWGRLGNGSTGDQKTPVSVSGVNTSISVSTGYSHACAVLSDGTIKCWGKNTYGQLGNGTSVDSYTPVSVSGISTAISVSSGYMHTCAVLSGWGVKCWGYGNRGQLGNGLSTSQTQPVEVEYFGN